MTSVPRRLLAQLLTAVFVASLIGYSTVATPASTAAARSHGGKAHLRSSAHSRAARSGGQPLVRGCHRNKNHRARRCTRPRWRCARATKRRVPAGCRVRMHGAPRDSAPAGSQGPSGGPASDPNQAPAVGPVAPPVDPPATPPAPVIDLPPPAGDVSPPVSTPPLFGFNDQSIGYSLASPAQDAQLSQRGGAKIARITFDWRWAEANPGQWDLSRYDALYREMTTRGIRPVWVLLFAPHWAWDPSVNCDQWHQDCTYPPAPSHDADWQNMVDLVVRRYPLSAAIEVWNEPNLYAFWRPQPDPARYAQLLEEAHTAVKAAAPAMPVLGGSVTNSPVDGAWGLSEASFLRGVFANGGGSSMDGVSLHLYKQGAGAADSVGNGLRDIRAARDAAGFGGLPIWITELGLSTTDTNPDYRVSEQGQADGLVNDYRRLATMPDIAAVIVHTLIERPPASGATEVGFGLVHEDFTPKPAYCALAVAVGATDPCP
jgi:hypothetical protein